MAASFEHFARNSPDALASFDAAGRLAFANQSFINLFMYGREGVGEYTLDHLNFSPSLRSALSRGMACAGRNGKEERFTCKEFIDTTEREFLCRIVPLQEPDGEMLTLVELRDETASVELRNALLSGRLSEHQAEYLKGRRRRLFFGALEEFPGFVYMQRRDYTVAYANRKVRNYYGETGTRLCYEVFSGRQTPCLVCPTFEVFETGQPVEWEFDDREGRTFRIYDYPFEDETGEPLVMELGIDITDLKRVERELFQAQKLRAIGVLAGGMAHDLNNNLVPIIFNIDHALNGTTDAKTREVLDEALQAAYRAANLVVQVLEYSRQQDVSRTTLHTMPLLRQSIETFRSSLPGSVVLDVQFRTDRDSIRANPAQVQQIVLNLLRNAEQAMPGGGTISVALDDAVVHSRESTPHPALIPGEYLALSVRDTGGGIEPRDVERIFEPFFTTKKSRGGTGMGLAIVHSILSRSGGAVKVDSTPGMGSTFTAYLPQAPPPAEPPPAQSYGIAGGTGRLLLVDDEPGVLSAMARTLREAGYEVDTAQSGEEGFAEFSQAPQRYSLVLADRSMPGISGMEMSARMLALDKGARIVICTGHVEPLLEKQAFAQGIAGFAMKPMSPYTLVETVKKYCR